MLQPSTLRESLERAARDDPFFFVREPFVLGLFVCFFAAGVAGALFSLVLGRAALGRRACFLAALCYSLGLMVLVYGFALPLAGDASRFWNPVADLATDVGWLTLALVHAMFGLTLAACLAPARRRAPSGPRLGMETETEAGRL